MDETSKNRIMIVGGDSHFLYLMQRFVRTSAHSIVMANLGDDVLAFARCENPVAIVLEVDQLETAGWRTLRGLKTDPVTSNIPVIACSWLDEEARGLAEGASVYLRMPILYDDFEAALTATLAKEQND
jgi:two-component system, cell cycle response regulator DivK